MGRRLDLTNQQSERFQLKLVTVVVVVVVVGGGAWIDSMESQGGIVKEMVHQNCRRLGLEQLNGEV
jgi:hypothetical protein